MAATARAVDLTNVKDGGVFKPRRKPEGDYRAKIVKADDHLKDGKLPGWVLTIQVEGDARSTYPLYLSPEKNQAWKIAQVCRAAGLNVKNSKVRFDPNKLVNKAVGVYLEDDEFEGRMKSTIGELFPVSEVGANADEDAPEDEEIDVDEEEIPDEEEEEEEPEPTPPPRKRTPRRKPEPEPEPEEEEEDEDEGEEPAPPPRRRKPAAAAPTPTRRRKPAPKPEPEDDEDLDLDDLDD